MEDYCVLQGRRLLLSEVDIPLNNERVRYEPALIPKGKSYLCKRCGNDTPYLFAQTPCVHCGTCVYCRKCIMMGRVQSCSTLVSMHPEPLPIQNKPLSWNGTLSIGQKQASDAIVRAVIEKKEHLIWAVCGAGKTEMLFAGIETALQRGERVCIAAPRTDVVLELHPRLQQVFPHIDVIALYGNSPDRHRNVPLVIATTHQLLRYYRAFDILIIDEVDAFPYTVDKTLRYAAEQARKQQAALIHLTATPSKLWKREIKQGKRSATIISSRYHRQPLPLPMFVWSGNWKAHIKKGRLPAAVQNWIRTHVESKRPVFLFVSKVSYVQPLVACLKQFYPSTEGVHAEDPDRKQKVAAFRKGMLSVLVTTTILERGVTVANLQVAVLGAEEPIFTESALVQIAGRVGRNASFPTGDVVLFHFGKTKAMVAARRHIQSMNRAARRKDHLS
ncbi:DEAD/DEAH box helicase [Ectobacillus antri]|uniref:DEAD/DEAH box helicase n=1 Tax=Ectobacillus antri TaxID=2486280 RepID=A0ABT6H8T1_9BACI|nr:DEAD/DEAH box helicase [Ectobacillus antri]MDG4657180.1 DEAD/DEAH box helicase [Ectobacillus antri]MDG5755193.1 DEAD/DEAH box helicase [Ectobacillus antri]